MGHVSVYETEFVFRSLMAWGKKLFPICMQMICDANDAEPKHCWLLRNEMHAFVFINEMKVVSEKRQ